MASGLGGRLRAILGLDTREFEAGSNRARREARSLGRDIEGSMTGAIAKISGMGKAFAVGLAGGVATAAFAGITSNIGQTIKGIAQIGDEAKRAGMSLESFQEWKFVAEQNRIGIDAMVDGFKELSLRADEFVVTGGGSAADAFTRLGYSADDLREKMKNPSELMLEIIGRLGRMDSAAQIRIFDELLGGSGGERFVELLSQGEGTLRATIARAHELRVVMGDDMIAKADELDRKWQELTIRVATWGKTAALAIANLPVDLFNTQLREIFPDEAQARNLLGPLYDELSRSSSLTDDQVTSLTALRDRYDDLGDAAYKASTELASAASQADMLGLEDLWQVLADGSNELRDLADQFAAGNIDGERFAARMAEIQQNAANAFTALDEADRLNFSPAISEVERLGGVISTVTGLARSLYAAVRSAANLEPEAGNGFIGPPAPPESALAPGSSIRPQRQGVNSYGDWIAAQEDAAKPKGGSKKPEVDDYTAATVAIREEIAALEAESAAFLAVQQSGRDYGDAIEYARRRAELMHAAQKAGKEITPELRAEIDQLAQTYVTAGMNAEEAADRLDRIKENGERGADAMTNLFLSVMDGAEGAKAAVASLLLEIAKIQMQKAMLGAAGGGGGFLGWVGNLLSLPGNANGTQNWSGGLTRVNELGGEIMNLPRGTQIIPHDISKRLADSASANGGGGRVEIIPSPYFDAVVDDRAAGVAGPMVGSSMKMSQSAMQGQMNNIGRRGTQ